MSAAPAPAIGYPPAQDPSLAPYHNRPLGYLCLAGAIAIWAGIPTLLIWLSRKGPDVLKVGPLRGWIDGFAAWYGAQGGFVQQSTMFLGVLLIGFPLLAPPIVGSFRLFLRWQQLTAPLAAELLRRDPRPPVLYLRSFSVDRPSTPANSPEKGLLKALKAIGPVVSIGRPGEKLQTPGTARYYVRDSEWQGLVEHLLARCQAVALVLGETAGVEWELKTIVDGGRADRLLLVIVLPPEGDLGAAKRRLEQTFVDVPTDLGRYFHDDQMSTYNAVTGLGMIGVAMVEAGNRLRFLEPVVDEGVVYGDNNSPVGDYQTLNWRKTLMPFLINCKRQGRETGGEAPGPKPEQDDPAAFTPDPAPGP